MKTCTAWMWGAVAALVTATGTARADIPQGEGWIDIGYFFNTGGGDIHYSGDFADYIDSTLGTVDPPRTQITIAFGQALTDLGYSAFDEVRVIDSGTNAYGQKSPGADIDLFTFDHLPGEVTLEYAYDGPNIVHLVEGPSDLAHRVASLDAASAQHDYNATLHVSLGDSGVLSALFDGWPTPGGGGDGGGGGGDGGGDGGAHPDRGGIIPLRDLPGELPVMHISESGMTESFHVYVHATNIPGPAGLGLLSLAGLVRRRSRRRSN